MAKSTPATLALQKAKLAFQLHTYVYDPDADRVGMAAAEALSVPPARMLKTLIAQVDGKPVCAVIRSDRELSLKKLAQTFGGKHAQMQAPAEAERLTGYHVGGISPLGQRRRLPTVLDADALNHPTVYLNGGQRGLQIEIDPASLRSALAAEVRDVLADG